MKQKLTLVGMAVMAIAGCGGPTAPSPGKPPIIQRIQVESPDVRVGGGIRVKAQVASESGDLVYAWHADDGLITSPSGTATQWLAPEEVPYTPFPVTISLIVKDRFGRNVKATQEIRVHQQGLSPL